MSASVVLYVVIKSNIIFWMNVYVFWAFNFVNKKLKKVGVGIFYLNIILYLCCMNKLRGYTHATESQLGQKQAVQVIDACGVSKKYSDKIEK